SYAHAGEPGRPATPAEAAVDTPPFQLPGVSSPKDGTCWVNNQSVVATEGTRLTSKVFLPKITRPDQKFPTILMISS
ncbi:hydrolase, partial [Burkholderia pseudomallei]